MKYLKCIVVALFIFQTASVCAEEPTKEELQSQISSLQNQIRDLQQQRNSQPPVRGIVVVEPYKPTDLRINRQLRLGEVQIVVNDQNMPYKASLGSMVRFLRFGIIPRGEPIGLLQIRWRVQGFEPVWCGIQEVTARVGNDTIGWRTYPCQFDHGYYSVLIPGNDVSVYRNIFIELVGRPVGGAGHEVYASIDSEDDVVAYGGRYGYRIPVRLRERSDWTNRQREKFGLPWIDGPRVHLIGAEKG